MQFHDPDGSTVGFTETSPYAGVSGELDVPVLPALTLQCHPDPTRIGERALLAPLTSGSEVRLSRFEPEFFAPGATSGRPLEDPYLSRKPWRILGLRDGSVVFDPGLSRTKLHLDGAPVESARQFSAQEVQRGLVLELSGRVTLLLHLHVEVREKDPRRWGLVGENVAVRRLREDIRRLADLGTPVLIRGATGSGKELVARALHDAGPRADKPFVAVNLGALPPSLAAAELFGASRGAFTGATRDQEGYFLEAQDGTLFLDEIGEAPPEVQVLLLRALESREVHPLGAQRPRPFRARVVAATDSDLEARVRDDSFREPLIHRLSGYVLWLPPLKERLDDLGRLFLHFLRLELEALGETSRLAVPGDPSRPWLPAELMTRLLDYGWPGNVRQLRNVVRQLVIGNRGRSQLRMVPAVKRILSSVEEPPTPAPRPISEVEAKPAAGRRPSEVLPDELEAALRDAHWELAAAARALGISRPSLYNLVQQHASLRTAADLSTDEIRDCHRSCSGDLDAMANQLRISASALGRRVRELGLS